jgi:hypothetical protein
MPDYVTDTNPIELYAYSDFTYTDLVFSETMANGGGLFVSKTMLQPGRLDLLSFTASNYYAFA